MHTQIDVLPLAQPIVELVHAAGVFGGEFSRAGDREHLSESLENARSLYESTQAAVLVVEEMNRAWPNSKAAAVIEFLNEIGEDFKTIEQTIEQRLSDGKDFASAA